MEGGAANESRPSIGGSSGRLSCPHAETRTRASRVPDVVEIRHSAASSSNRASVTSVRNRILSSTRYLRAQCHRYSRISGCGGNRRDQSVLRSNENEYRWEGTSQAAPG